MSIWQDTNGSLHDDMNGAALTLPSWPQGMTELTAVQAQALQNPAPTTAQLIASIDSAVQIALDQKAQVKGYTDAATCVSYMNSTNTTWKADATAMNTWRDAVWVYTFAQEALTTLPTPAAVVAGLPVAPW